MIELSLQVFLNYCNQFKPRFEKFARQKQPPEAFCKKVFLKISQNSQEKTCTRALFLIKLIKKKN